MLQPAAAFLCYATSIHNMLRRSSVWTSWLDQVQGLTWWNLRIWRTSTGIKQIFESRTLLEALRMLISSLRSYRTRAFVLDSGPSLSPSLSLSEFFFFSQAYLLSWVFLCLCSCSALLAALWTSHWANCSVHPRDIMSSVSPAPFCTATWKASPIITSPSSTFQHIL